MGTLTELRQKIDDLVVLQKNETDDFMSSMQHVLQQSHDARDAQREVEHDFEVSLSREKAERDKAVTIMAKFRREGTAVMDQLKDALHSVQHKYRSELQRNDDLEAALHSAQRQRGAAGRATSPAPGSGEQHRKIEQLAMMLDDQDLLLTELQKRNGSLESRVQALTQQRDRLMDNEVQQMQTSDFTGRLAELMSAFTAAPESIDRDEAAALIRMLNQQLKAERLQRLRVEEQSGRMAAAQDQLVDKLETRIREHHQLAQQSSSNRNSPRAFRGSARGTPRQAVSDAPQVPRLSAATTPRGGTVATRTSNEQYPVESPSRIPPTSAPSVPAVPPSEPRQQETIGLEDVGEQHTNMADARRTPPRAGRPASSTIPSLEDQLNAVSAEFQTSMKQWQDVVGGDPNAPQRTNTAADEEFMPESPTPN
jgi:hypothetical protein